MKYKNDLSFLIDKTLSLYEHQSSYNPNMPLRGFLYYADLYRKLIHRSERLYSKHLLKIPRPHYIVLYNGNEKDMVEERRTLRLSDAFETDIGAGEYEWTATMININSGKNKFILDSCHVDVRAGHHCAQPLLAYLGVRSCARASLAFYNTTADIDRFLAALGGVRKEMGYAE